EGREARIDIRKTALADVGAVQARDPKFLPEIRSVVAARDLLILALISEYAVQQHGRRERLGVSDRTVVDLRVSDARIAAGRGTAALAEDGERRDERVHAAVLAPPLPR